MTSPSRSPRRRLVVALATGAAACAAAPAAAAPEISGADGQTWNASTAPVTYTIVGSEPGAQVAWAVSDGPYSIGGQGASPLTIVLNGLADGRYRLFAQQRAPFDPRPALRQFSLDATPPAIAILAPAAGASYAEGQLVTADYRCDGATSCAGPVTSGQPIDTTSAGPRSFSVTAHDAAGNVATLSHGYVVVAPTPPAPTPPAPAPTPPAPTPTAPPPAAPTPVAPTPVVPGLASTPLAPAPPAAPAPSARPVRVLLPPMPNASRLRPRKGARVASARPLLRWRARRGARLYNVQVFRLQGTRFVKVLSVFPRRTAVRIPPRRLRPGAKHVWRVWPMVGRRFTKAPLGVSYFQVRPKARRSR